MKFNRTTNKHKEKNFDEFFEKHVVDLKKKITNSYGDDDSEDEGYKFIGSDDKKNEKNKKKHIIFLILASVFILMLTFVLITINEVYSCFKSNGYERVIDIPYGSSTKKISYILKENQIIDYPWLFSTYASANGIQNLKYGTFNLNTSMSYDEIIGILSEDSNNVNQDKFVISEGSDMFTLCSSNECHKFISSEEIVKELNNKENYSKYNFTKKISESEISKSYYPMEGFCAMATFYIDSKSDAKSIANNILRKTDELLSNLYDDISNSKMDLWEIMTIASIIEAETSNEDDMKNISSVLHNRYKNDSYQSLKCDPTKKYALKIKENMEKYQNVDNGKVDSYNTYKCFGLPSGPICNPSIKAIKAAIYPNQTNYYYFCANINTKEVFYASDYEEHKQNLIKSGVSN